MPKHLQVLFFLTLLTALYTTKSHAASVNTVHSITSNPVFLEQSIKVSTITRGLNAANQPIYKPAVQTIARSVFITAFRRSIALTPYGIAALAAFEAYDYFIDDSGNLVQSETIYSGNYCKNTQGLTVPIYGQACTSTELISQIISVNGDRYGGPLSFSAIYNVGNEYTLFFKLPNGNTSLFGRISSIKPPSTQEVSVTDEQLYDTWEAYVHDNSEMNHKGIFLNADGTVNPEFFPNPTFEINTVAEQVNADLYGSGLLQKTDPTADNYASPDVYDAAKKLWESQNLTPEQQADALNENLKQPITQDQYASEQALKETREEIKMTNAANLLKALDIKPNDYTTASQQNLDSTLEMLNTTSDLPISDFNNYLNFTTSDTCKTIPLPIVGDFPSASQCDKLGSVKDFLGYFLSILLIWNIVNTLLKEAN